MWIALHENRDTRKFWLKESGLYLKMADKTFCIRVNNFINLTTRSVDRGKNIFKIYLGFKTMFYPSIL